MQTPGAAVAARCPSPAAWPHAVGQVQSCAECTELGKQQWSCLAGAANKVSQPEEGKEHPASKSAAVRASPGEQAARRCREDRGGWHQPAQPPWSHSGEQNVEVQYCQELLFALVCVGGEAGDVWASGGSSDFSIQPSHFLYGQGLDEAILPWVYKWQSWNLLGKSFLLKSS